MQLFWYHSPVRFYRNLEELQDMTNPQNTQYFGEKSPYPLEKGVLHRFLIPNYQNEVSSNDLSLWIGKTQIGCEFGISNGKLFRVTFVSDENISGNLEIKQGSETIFYSNCVRFLDSTDGAGRKFLRIATKHYYNRNLFAFDGSNYDWMITNLPAYCLGQFRVDADLQTVRTGGNNTLQVKETYLDEIVSYQFSGKGDSNIISFIQVHSTNNEFYIDGTKRTCIEKIDADEFAMFGTMKFVNVKDDFGLNIPFDENAIFEDVMRQVLSNDSKTVIYIDNNSNAIPVK